MHKVLGAKNKMKDLLKIHHASPPKHPSLQSGAEHLLFRGDDQLSLLRLTPPQVAQIS